MQIQCPACQKPLVVPQIASAPPAPAGKYQSRSGASPPATRFTGQRPGGKSKGGGAAKALKVGAVVVVLGVGFYFGFTFLADWQKKSNENRRDDGGGGQLGHIADLYDVLDKTDPERYETPRMDMETESPQPRRARAGADGEAPVDPNKQLPIIPAAWTLELAEGKVPEGRVNGMISGANFVIEAARLDLVGPSYVLTLRQGAGVSADREILIYLRLKAGESLAGHTWSITRDMKGTGVPSVIKRWKTNPKYAPQQKVFSSGYAMKLELGQLEDGLISGKIFIALPDPEQSVAAGIFHASTSLAGGGFVSPSMPAGGAEMDDAMRARYGVGR